MLWLYEDLKEEEGKDMGKKIKGKKVSYKIEGKDEGGNKIRGKRSTVRQVGIIRRS